MELEELLKAVHKKIIDYRARKGFGDNEFAGLAGLSNPALVPIDGEKYTESGKLKTIDLRTLLKIFNGHPELKVEILDYLRTNTDEKPTSEVKDKNSPKDPQLSDAELLELFRHSFRNVKADLDEKTKKISVLEARILELEKLLKEEQKKKVSKTD